MIEETDVARWQQIYDRQLELNRSMRAELKALKSRQERVEILEQVERSLSAENAKLRAELKALKDENAFMREALDAAHAALGEGND